jgi:hypothetical protein
MGEGLALPSSLTNGFHEKALSVKADLTMFACRRSRLRQRPGGSGMAQGCLALREMAELGIADDRVVGIDLDALP